MARRILLRLISWIALITVVAIPGGRQDWRRSNEMAAVRSIQILSTMQTQYLSQFGRYARTLADLGPYGADLIPQSLASGEQSGYVFVVTSTPAGFAITATPKIRGPAGWRAFYSDQSMVIHQDRGPGPATAKSPEFQ